MPYSYNNNCSQLPRTTTFIPINLAHETWIFSLKLLEIRRFPALHDRVVDVVSTLLQTRLLPTNQMVSISSYISIFLKTNHPYQILCTDHYICRSIEKISLLFPKLRNYLSLGTIKIRLFAIIYWINLTCIYFNFFKVENLVAIELCYINTNHPDFTDGASVVSAMLTANDVSYYHYYPSDIPITLKLFLIQ